MDIVVACEIIAAASAVIGAPSAVFTHLYTRIGRVEKQVQAQAVAATRTVTSEELHRALDTHAQREEERRDKVWDAIANLATKHDLHREVDRLAAALGPQRLRDGSD